MTQKWRWVLSLDLDFNLDTGPGLDLELDNCREEAELWNRTSHFL